MMSSNAQRPSKPIRKVKLALETTYQKIRMAWGWNEQSNVLQKKWEDKEAKKTQHSNTKIRNQNACVLCAVLKKGMTTTQWNGNAGIGFTNDSCC